MNPLIIVGIIAGVLAIGLGIQTKRLENAKAEHADFVAQVKALGEEQNRKAKQKEAEDANRIKTALGERDVALAKLRQSARTRSRQLSAAPSAPAGSNQVCYGAPAYNAAMGEFGKSLERFVDEARGFAQEGDSAQIDAKTLLKSWPASLKSP